MIGISILICLLAALTYLAVTRRLYEAYAQLLVLQQGGRPLNVANTDPSRLMEGTDDYIPTHALILSSPLVVKRSIDRIGLDRLPSALEARRANQDPVEGVINRLRVTRPDRMAKILRVEYRAGDRDEVVRMVEAITESYNQVLEETFQKSNSSTVIALISKARDELSQELQDLEGKYPELRRRTPSPITGAEGRSFLASRVARWDRAANEAMIKSVQLKRQLELGRKLAGEGTELWALSHAISQLGGDTSSLTAILASSPDGAGDYIRQLAQEHQQLNERFGPNDTKVRELKAQIQRVRESVRGARSRLEAGEVRDLLSALEQSLQSVEVMRDELGKQYDQSQKEAKQFELDLLADDDLRNKLERQRMLFSTVVEQLKQARFVSDYSSVSSQIIEPAKLPLKPVWPRTGLTLGLALVLGSMLGMSVVIVLDRLDPRIRSLDQLRRVTGLSIIGQVAIIPKSLARVLGSFGLISHSMPQSAWAEAYRAIRTNIDFLRRAKRLQVLLVTSAYADEGKTTAASNLAISFAATGRKVLLIDADLRHPSLDPIHNVDRALGLSSLLNDAMSLNFAVQQSRINGLDIVTAGPEVPNPAELLSSPRLVELLDEARNSYDIILVDSSPLLAVTDPAIIGAVADGIILTVRAWMLDHHDAEQSVELLQSLGTPILGLLVNGIHPGESGYSSRCRYSGHRSDPASRLTLGEDPPATIAARSQPQDNGHSESNSREPFVVCAAVNNVPVLDEWSTRSGSRE
jgi:capsular exopolysaccharide synthesis family protein